MEDFNIEEWKRIARDLGVPLQWILDWRVIRAWEKSQEDGILDEMINEYGL